MSDDKVSEAYRQQMHAIAETLDEFLNPGLQGDDRKIGFAVLIFPFGETHDGRVNWISNAANRQDMAALMKEMIVRWEGKGFSVRNRQ